MNRIFGTKSTKQREVDDHGELIDALKHKDPDNAEKTVRKHIYRSYCEFVDLNNKKHAEQQIGEKVWF